MAKFSLHYTNTYLKDLKLARRRRLDEDRLNEVIRHRDTHHLALPYRHPHRHLRKRQETVATGISFLIASNPQPKILCPYKCPIAVNDMHYRPEPLNKLTYCC